MKKMFILVIAFVMALSSICFASDLNVFNEHLKSEKELGICTEITLPAGTIIRSSSIAFPTGEDGLHGKPMYKDFVHSSSRYQNDQIVILVKKTTIYLTDGGFYTNTFKTLEGYLKNIEKKTSITRDDLTINIQPKK